MEDLFTASLAINNQNVSYHVVFDKEKYIFSSESSNTALRTFSFKREHDEWQEQEQLSPDIRNQAIDALEQYLLKQH